MYVSGGEIGRQMPEFNVKIILWNFEIVAAEKNNSCLLNSKIHLQYFFPI